VDGAVIGGDTIGELLPDSAFTVGINEPSSSVPFELYYSPQSGSLTIASPETIQELVVIDATGRVVTQRSRPTLPETIATSSFPAGLYLVNVRTSNATATRRIAITP
jgi:hypothetical protein